MNNIPVMEASMIHSIFYKTTLEYYLVMDLKTVPFQLKLRPSPAHRDEM